jgi:hypothetical protein
VQAIGYVRVSTDRQAEQGVSLEAQEAKMRAMALVQGTDLIDVIVDGGESGKNLKRPGLERLMSRVNSGKVQAVIIAKLDRLTRSVKDLAACFSRKQGRPRIGRGIARYGLSGGASSYNHHGRRVSMGKRSDRREAGTPGATNASTASAPAMCRTGSASPPTDAMSSQTARSRRRWWRSRSGGHMAIAFGESPPHRMIAATARDAARPGG